MSPMKPMKVYPYRFCTISGERKYLFYWNKNIIKYIETFKDANIYSSNKLIIALIAVFTLTNMICSNATVQTPLRFTFCSMNFIVKIINAVNIYILYDIIK